MVPIISAGICFLPSIFYVGNIVYCYFVNPDNVRNSTRNQIQENNIRELVLPILEKHGIRNDIQFREVADIGAFTMGGNCTKYATIFVCPKLREIDEEAFQLGVKHEIGHIKYSDVISTNIVALIVSIAVAILFPYVIGTSIIAGIVTGILSFVIAVKIQSIAKRYREKKADDFAIANASNVELRGGIRLFETVQKLIDKEELPESDIHPPTLSRIEKIEQELKKRGQPYIETHLDILKTVNISRLFQGRPRFAVNDYIEAMNADVRLRALGLKLRQEDFVGYEA